jgi:hypothetical protein
MGDVADHMHEDTGGYAKVGWSISGQVKQHILGLPQATFGKGEIGLGGNADERGPLQITFHLPTLTSAWVQGQQC